MFRKDGTFVKEAFIRLPPGGKGSLGARPGDIAFSGDPAQRFVYMVDMANSKVHVVARDSLQIVASFGRRGHWAGQFESPHSLAIDSKGNLFVAETLQGRRVQKFVPKGRR